MIEMGPEGRELTAAGQVVARVRPRSLAEDGRVTVSGRFPWRERKRRIRRGRAARRRNCSRRPDESVCLPREPSIRCSPLEVSHSQGAADGGDRRVRSRGRRTLVLESLVPGAGGRHPRRKTLPEHVRSVEAEGIRAGEADRRRPHRHQRALHRGHLCQRPRRAAEGLCQNGGRRRRLGYKAGDFSYNTGKLRCPVCDGTGIISLDVQFLPDVEIPCPECRGCRYSREAQLVRSTGRRIPCRTGWTWT